MKLVIVESPAKAQTINKYLGNDYKVIASVGHVRDLPSKDGAVLPEDNFKMSWEMHKDKEKVVKEIISELKIADTLILATDPDREGEAISWHLKEILNSKKTIQDKPVQRVVFNEITKNAVLEAGGWSLGMGGFGEVLPYHENKMFLNYEKLDQYGLPTIVFDAEFKENERIMKEDWKIQAAEMLEDAGFKDVNIFDSNAPIGKGIHEMGTARMGKDPKTSVLNKHNQVHGVPNVFVTDGACMTSSANQNPSLTYMALTARAANHAVEELKKQNL